MRSSSSKEPPLTSGRPDPELLGHAYRHYAALYRSGIIGIISGEDDRILDANDAFLEMVGYSRDEFEAGGLPWVEMTPPEHLEQDMRELEQMLRRGSAGPVEKEYIRKDGRRVPVLIGGSTLETEPFRWVSFVLDISERKEAEARYRGLFESAADAILVADADSRYVDVNDHACELLGYTREELLRLRVSDVVAGEPQATEEEYQRFMAEGRWHGETVLRRKDGSLVTAEAAAATLELPTRTIYLSSLRDIEDRKRTERERESLLLRERRARAEADRAAGRLRRLQSILDASLGYLPFERFLRELLGRIRDVLRVDAATLFLRTVVGDELVARASVGPEGTDPVPSARIPMGRGFAGGIAASGRARVTEASRIEPPGPDGAKSVAGVPLILEGRVIGVLQVTVRAERRFSEDDGRLLELVAARIASALERAKIQDERERMGRALQESFLPTHLPAIPGVEVAAGYQPASEGNQVGGDFYDVFEVAGGSWGVAIGDVCGKGAQAAATMGIARHSLRAIGRQQSRPSSVLSTLNDLLMREDDSAAFVTASFLRLRPTDAGVRATLSSGGHPLPLLATPDGTVQEVGGPGLLLGIFPVTLTDTVVDLSPGDTMVLYTDGVVDDRGSTPGIEHLTRLLQEGSRLEPVTLSERIRGLADARADDDKAWLVLRATGPT